MFAVEKNRLYYFHIIKYFLRWMWATGWQPMIIINIIYEIDITAIVPSSSPRKRKQLDSNLFPINRPLMHTIQLLDNEHKSILMYTPRLFHFLVSLLFRFSWFFAFFIIAGSHVYFHYSPADSGLHLFDWIFTPHRTQRRDRAGKKIEYVFAYYTLFMCAVVMTASALPIYSYLSTVFLAFSNGNQTQTRLMWYIHRTMKTNLKSRLFTFVVRKCVAWAWPIPPAAAGLYQ